MPVYTTVANGWYSEGFLCIYNNIDWTTSLHLSAKLITPEYHDTINTQVTPNIMRLLHQAHNSFISITKNDLQWTGCLPKLLLIFIIVLYQYFCRDWLYIFCAGSFAKPVVLTVARWGSLLTSYIMLLLIQSLSKPLQLSYGDGFLFNLVMFPPFLLNMDILTNELEIEQYSLAKSQLINISNNQFISNHHRQHMAACGTYLLTKCIVDSLAVSLYVC